MYSFSIIGAGRVGKTVSRLLRQKGYRVDYVINKTIKSASDSVEFIGGGTPACYINDNISRSNLILVGVPDDVIRDIAVKLKSIKSINVISGIIHFSGSIPSEVLKESGIMNYGSIHFVRSFADPESAFKGFNNTYAAYECSKGFESIIMRILTDLHSRPINISGFNKYIYHAACVFSSNFLVTIAHIATDLLKINGMSNDDAVKLFISLASGTLLNIESKGPVNSLTGPIERGDSETIKNHIDKLPKQYKNIYKQLSIVTMDIARQKGVDSKKLDEIYDSLYNC